MIHFTYLKSQQWTFWDKKKLFFEAHWWFSNMRHTTEKKSTMEISLNTLNMKKSHVFFAI